MSLLWRILSVAALLVSAVILILSILSVRKEQRVRPGLDLLRLGVTAATTVLMARLLGITTSEALMGLGFLVGLLLGVYEGLHLRVRFLGKGTFAKRSALGVAAWALGVIVVQAAGVVGRIGLADFGLAMSMLGIGQLIGLLTGRWQTVMTARRAGSGAAVACLLWLSLGGAVLPGLASAARAADAVDIRAVMAGQVPGVGVEVRGNGSFMGAALSLVFTNQNASEVAVTVPVGLLFVPENEGVQTMVAAGGETVTVPPAGGGSRYSTAIVAFCAQFHDDIPSPDDVFTAGEPATGELAAVVALIHAGGEYGRDQQEAVWQVTDGYDISANAAAAALVEAAEARIENDSAIGASEIRAIDGDPENLLNNCPTNRAAFGDPRLDADRCFSFRYEAPAGGIRSAVVYLSIEAPTGSLQDTDSVGLAVGTAFPEQCGLGGGMAGCVTVHGGFAGGERSLTLDLLDLACDPTFAGTQEMQDAVRRQLESGVVHLVLQDDTMVREGRLALNEGPPALPCGTSAQAAPVTAIVPCHCSELTAGEGTRTSLAGLGGAAALLLTALAGSGNTLGSMAAAWRGGGPKGVADFFRGGGGGVAFEWADPQAALGGGRAKAALDRLPSELRAQVESTLAARLEKRQLDALAASVNAAVGPLDPGADPAEVLRAHPKAAGLLEQVPAGVRVRIQEDLLAGWQEQQVTGAAEEAVGALRRDRAVELVREAISRRDGGTVQQVLAAMGEEGRSRVWPRAVLGLEPQAAALEYPPPAPGGTGARAVDSAVDLEGYLDAEADVGGALPGGGEAEGVLARLPGGMRSRVQSRLAEKLEAARVDRWAAKLEEAAGAGGGAALESPEARRALEVLPPGLRERIGTSAARVLDDRRVAGLARSARRLIEEERAVGLLRAAVGLGDGDRVDAVMNAVGAALDGAGQADLEQLAQRAVPGGTRALAGLARAGSPVAPPDLTEHLAGEADLLSAARRTAGVEALLEQAGSLRPRVEAELGRALEAGRVGRVVRKAAELVSPGEQAASDILETVRQLPGVRDLLEDLPLASRRTAYRLLGERLAAKQFEGAVEEVERALRLDGAEEALRRAARAGNLDAAERALTGLTPEQARGVEAAALGG